MQSPFAGDCAKKSPLMRAFLYPDGIFSGFGSSERLVEAVQNERAVTLFVKRTHVGADEFSRLPAFGRRKTDHCLERGGKKRIVAVGSVRQNGRRGDAARFLFNRKKHREKNPTGRRCAACAENSASFFK